MDTISSKLLPFLTRMMLDWEHGMSIELRLTTRSTVSTTVTLNGITKEGPFTFRASADNTGQPIQTRFRVPDIPIMVSALTTGTTTDHGQMYASVDLMINGNVLATLCAGLLTNEKGISWPITSNVDAVPGRGEFLQISSADPAAGAEISIIVPSAETWRVIAIGVVLVTDATAATRVPHIILNPGSDVPINTISPTGQTASTTRRYSIANYGHMIDAADDDDILIPIPEGIWLNPDSQIITETTNLQAGDNWGVMRVHVERFFMSSI